MPIPEETPGTSRRRFVAYVLAAPTLAVAVQYGLIDLGGDRAAAAEIGPNGKPAPHADNSGQPVPSTPQVYDTYDLSDFLTDSCRPTNYLLTLDVRRDGSVHFDLPRAEVGQGITTAVAMIIAEEMDVPLHRVTVTLRDADPALLYNQLTGGSNTIHSLWEPLRAAAASARGQLSGAAAEHWGVNPAAVSTRGGAVHGPDGQILDYGRLTALAAAGTTHEVPYTLKAASQYKIIGSRVTRLDALDAVTGKKQFAMDVKVPNAKPCMVAHGPHIRTTPKSLNNRDAILKMPGVTHVGLISTGVAVRANTFGQCIDAVRAMQVSWNPGTVDEINNSIVAKVLRSVELPIPPAAPGIDTIEHTFRFNFRSGSPLEPNAAIVDVRSGSAEIWSSLKNPIIAKQRIAEFLGMDQDAVTVHVTTGGGSFGRHLFFDAAMEATEASKLFGVPVRVMWHRTEDSRHGRVHPASVSRCRIGYDSSGSVLSYDMRHTGVATDYTHGLGEMYSGALTSAHYPGFPLSGNLSVAQGIYTLSASMPYNFGEISNLLNEHYDYDTFNTSSVRNVYSPDTATVRELMVDEMAKKLGMDPLEFRRKFVKSPRILKVLNAVAERGKWGRRMTPGTAQGIAIHTEYKAVVVCLMEIDARPRTVNRKIRDAYTGPRVTRVTIAADSGPIINPSGFEAMLMGGAMDGIAQALTASLHFSDGLPAEGSWDDYHYTRQWNAPFVVDAFTVPSEEEVPGGAGELGCGVSQAAAACAYSRAVGRMVTEFPINFHEPLDFHVKTRVPPVPQSPTNGLKYTR